MSCLLARKCRVPKMLGKWAGVRRDDFCLEVLGRCSWRTWHLRTESRDRYVKMSEEERPCQGWAQFKKTQGGRKAQGTQDWME